MTEIAMHPSLTSEIAVTDCLKLRRLQLEDASRIFEILQADSEIQTRITWVGGKNTIGSIEDSIATFMGQRASRYGLISEDKLLGYVGVFRSPISSTSYDMGYFIDPAARGRGYVPRAVTALMAVTKEQVPVSSFGLNIADDNAPSQAVAAKLGFTRTDTTYYDIVLNCEERRYEKVVNVD
jgi:RimJ/RimL family protein N-acetyltransferase